MSIEASVQHFIQRMSQQRFVYHMREGEQINGDGTTVVAQPMRTAARPGVQKTVVGLGIDCSHLLQRYLLSLGLKHDYMATAALVSKKALTPKALEILEPIDMSSISVGDIIHFRGSQGHVGIVTEWDPDKKQGRIFQAGVTSQVSEQRFSADRGFGKMPIEAISRPRVEIVTEESKDTATAELVRLEKEGRLAIELADGRTDIFTKRSLELSALAFNRIDAAERPIERRSLLSRFADAVGTFVSGFKTAVGTNEDIAPTAANLDAQQAEIQAKRLGGDSEAGLYGGLGLLGWVLYILERSTDRLTQGSRNPSSSDGNAARPFDRLRRSRDEQRDSDLREEQQRRDRDRRAQQAQESERRRRDEGERRDDARRLLEEQEARDRDRRARELEEQRRRDAREAQERRDRESALSREQQRVAWDRDRAQEREARERQQERDAKDRLERLQRDAAERASRDRADREARDREQRQRVLDDQNQKSLGRDKLS